MLGNHPAHPVADFKNRLRIAKAIMPARRKRAKLPRKVPPRSVALSYYRAFAPILEAARRAAERALEPLLPALAAQAAEIRGDAGNVNDVLDAVGKEFFDRLKPAEIEALAERFARATSEWEKEQALKQTRAAFGVDVLGREPNLAAKSSAFVSENVALIKSIPSQYFDDLEKRVARAVARGATPKELAAEIAKAHGVADDRAMLIARDQIGSYYARVAEARQVAMGVTHYIWRTSNDERVREEHAALEGETFAWDDPPAPGNPGEDFQCRCYAEPVLDQLLDGDEPHAQEIAAREEPPEPQPAPVAEPVGPSVEEDLAASRAAHAAEVERRLAEQEAARAERQRVAEEHAQRQADYERQLLEQGSRLALAKAELERARAVQDPIVREHVENASGVSARTANQREAELARLASAPVDMQKIAGLAEGKAAGVREEVDKLIARSIGARLSTPDLQRKEIALTGAANVHHEWNGQIVVNEHLAAAAGNFVEHRGETPGQLQARQSAHEQRLAALNAEENRLASAIRAAKNNPEKRAALVAERDAFFERAREARLTVAPVDEAKSMQSLVHEAMHGHSPLAGSGAYTGVGVTVEEVTTELAARMVMESSFPGYKAPGHDGGSYANYIEPLTKGLADAVGVSTERAYEVLREASVDVKRDHVELANTPAELRDKFVAKIAARAGISEDRARALLGG